MYYGTFTFISFIISVALWWLSIQLGPFGKAIIKLATLSTLVFLGCVYKLLVQNGDPFRYLKQPNNIVLKQHKTLTNRLLKAGESLELHKEQNKDLKSDAQKSAYKAVYDEIYHHAYLATDALRHAGYETTAKKGKVSKIKTATLETEKIEELVATLSQLDEEFIKLENEAYSEGTEKIDDVIETLKEMV